MIDWRKVSRGLGVVLNLRDPPNVPPYGWSYFDHLVAVYVTLNSEDARADAVIKKASDKPDALTWGDIFMLENVIFSLQPPEVLERNAWIIRERFREIASGTVYDKYVESGVPKETDTPEKLSLLRADLCRVLDVLHWYYSLIPIRERIRKSLTTNCILMVMLYTGILAATLYYCRRADHSFIATLLCVLYFGIIGGFVSSQRRMQSIPTDTDPLISVFGLDNAGYYLWLSPLLGAVFAVILSLTFIAGILTGTVFPAFPAMQSKDGLSIFSFAWGALPIGSGEYAKLFVWSFLAGFAERLVPDSLDRLTASISSDKQAPQRGPSLPPGLTERGAPAGGPVPGRAPRATIAKETLADALNTGVVSADPASDEGAAKDER